MVALTSGEHRALEQLEKREHPFRRGATLLREHDRCGELVILRNGAMMSSVLLDDGSRQIPRFLFPGGMIAVSALVYGKALRRSPRWAMRWSAHSSASR